MKSIPLAPRPPKRADAAQNLLLLIRASAPVALREAATDQREPLDHHAELLPVSVAIVEDPLRYAVTKRALDIALVTISLPLVVPLCVIIALLVKATSPGPVLFRQTRVGRGGKTFVCYKFRSMLDRAHEYQVHLRHRNEADGPVFKLRDDPRLTRVGRFLRKTSIDEIPQLINVLIGDMSVVGPRPPIPEEVLRYSDHQLQRLGIKPGLTCIWQVSGRSTIGFDRWIELDLEYIQTRSLWTDLKIVVRTVPAVLFGKGAH